MQSSNPVDTKNPKKIGIVGCGYVSAFYMATADKHPHLDFVAAYDIDSERLKHFSEYYAIPKTESLDELIEKCELVLNLTTPESHFDVSKRCLKKKRSVYSEKPVTLSDAETETLVALAQQHNVNIFGAPCVHLSSMADTVLEFINEGKLGDIYTVYAEMDNDLVHLKQHEKWTNDFGISWPAKNEFESGATLEHAAYTLCLLRKWFGKASLIAVQNSVSIPDKIIPLHKKTADLSFALIEYPNNVSARLTCSIVAPRNHEIKIYGEKGVLTIEDIWFFDTPIYWQKYITPRNKPRLSPFKQKIKINNDGFPLGVNKDGSARMDFLRGVHDLSQRNRSDMDTMNTMAEVNTIVLSMNGPSEQTLQRPWIVIGTGHMADRMSRCLKRNGYCVDGIYSGQAGRAQAFASTLDIANAYDSLSDIPEANGQSAAYVASLNSHHYEQVKALLNKGYHVLCEKPLTLDPTTCAELFELARSKQLILQENLWSLFVPAAAQLKNQGSKAKQAELSFCSVIPYTNDSRQWNGTEGGCIYDLAIYPIAWSVLLFGDVESFDVLSAITEHDAISEFTMITHHQNGTQCKIKAGFYSNEHDIKINDEYFYPIYSPEYRATFSSPFLRKVKKKLRPPEFRAVDPYAHIIDTLNGESVTNDCPHPPEASQQVSKLLSEISERCQKIAAPPKSN